MSVPVIDLSPYMEGTPEGKRKVAAEVGRACRDIGFLTIVGHGVPKSLIDACYDVSAKFFDLPEPEKMKVERPAPDQIRGYSPVCGEGLTYSLDVPAPPDLKESLTVGPIDVPAGDDYFHGPQAGPHFAANLWPANPPDLKEIWTAYFQALEKLSADMMRIFALALDLPEHFFDDKIDRHISMFRVLNYPDQQAAPEPGQLRAGAHSDYDGLTIVCQDMVGGLQVQNQQGDWVDVKPVAGAFVVNIGDLMMNWTNDLWRSTMHRVINPPREHAIGSRRQSLVFFHQPNYDAMITVLDSCQSATNPAKYAPVTSGDYLRSKFVKQTTFGEGVA
jgi:isopenicillin N synthase-like dioxygenase